MTSRPTFIELNRNGGSAYSSARPSPSVDHPSPRVHHLAGDVPPPMSPLDAFAAQSRMLAKQLDDSKRNGRRLSRLPPMAVASSLAMPRPGYFRSTSVEREAATRDQHAIFTPDDEAPSGFRPELEEPTFRPQSFYPRLSGIGNGPIVHTESPSATPAGNTPFFTPTASQPVPASDYFGGVRAPTPESMTSDHKSETTRSPSSRTHGSSVSSHQASELSRGLSVESHSSQSLNQESLLPPKPPYSWRTPVARSTPADTDEEEHGQHPYGSRSQDRKMSASSAVSLPYTPLSPFSQNARPPSIGSEHSMGGSRLSRPTFNFSRPLSHSSRPSMEFPASSKPMPNLADSFEDSGMETPVSIESDSFFDANETNSSGAPSSFIYAKYSLPRGRMLNRGSTGLDNLIAMPDFDGEQTEAQSQREDPTSQPTESYVPASIPTPPHSAQSDDPPSASRKRNSTDSHISDQVQPHQVEFHHPPPVESLYGSYHESSPSINSGSTIKPSNPRNTIISAEFSAEDHFQKGIECHERGSLKESTYHLRIAARRNNPTAMLVYALACRHGWGMRPNPQEAVLWLRKAMDCASIELAESTSATLSTEQKAAKKARKAQFALSIYELGVSHMNGWGIEQDKALALRCFEIAAEWGDADAMAEAGYCYAQGVGCKKDMRKAAKFYRRAEEMGISTIGNSWIHKSKYNDDEPTADRRSRSRKISLSSPEKSKKPHEKSRTRGIFGRKKSYVGEL
ncbi:hypothetical protein MMC25_000033 [Agyrium rufum]|nr:hypothetical protein [Agyrium rufum]